MATPEVPLNQLHDFIEHATDEQVEDLVKHRPEDLLAHTRNCPPCDVKRRQALDRVLTKLPVEHRRRLTEAARLLVQSLGKRQS